jgi:hypothetical protein
MRLDEGEAQITGNRGSRLKQTPGVDRTLRFDDQRANPKREGEHEAGGARTFIPSSEQAARCAHRVWGVSRGHIKPVKRAVASRGGSGSWRSHTGEGPNGAARRMAGVNESGK